MYTVLFEIPDIKSTRDPKICLSCQTTLRNYYQFVTKCLVKQENIVEWHDQEACLAIKSEELDIKTEEEECDRNTYNSISLINSSAMLSENNEIKSFMDKSYNQEKIHTSIKSDPNQNGDEREMEYPKDHKLIEDVAIIRYHCKCCSYVTTEEGYLSKHVLIHRTRTYGYSFCAYKTKQKGDLTTHMLFHKDTSGVKTYQCALCPFKTKRKNNI
ncbi:hypothetical protein NQ318_021761 [Aromia moschata]|uniref:C2H2-type domain-containing protein n=1 Tax=Aromia moschata TaxID=1265417 RepID=A0AAV8XHR9_9CUCU|nr:hypothetical protein NQ318_021761 [Aromia moschata]